MNELLFFIATAISGSGLLDHLILKAIGGAVAGAVGGAVGWGVRIMLNRLRAWWRRG